MTALFWTIIAAAALCWFVAPVVDWTITKLQKQRRLKGPRGGRRR